MNLKILAIALLALPLVSLAQPEIPLESAQEKHCLSLNIYHEARGENKDSSGNPVNSLENWLVVAMITRNRRDNLSYPSGWCEVVYDPFQYSWTHDGKPDEPDLEDVVEALAWVRIEQFVEGFMANHRHIKDPTRGSIDYAECSVDNYWTRKYTLYKAFRNHCVYHR